MSIRDDLKESNKQKESVLNELAEYIDNEEKNQKLINEIAVTQGGYLLSTLSNMVKTEKIDSSKHFFIPQKGLKEMCEFNEFIQEFCDLYDNAAKISPNDRAVKFFESLIYNELITSKVEDYKRSKFYKNPLMVLFQLFNEKDFYDRGDYVLSSTLSSPIFNNVLKVVQKLTEKKEGIKVEFGHCFQVEHEDYGAEKIKSGSLIPAFIGEGKKPVVTDGSNCVSYKDKPTVGRIIACSLDKTMNFNTEKYGSKGYSFRSFLSYEVVFVNEQEEKPKKPSVIAE